MTNHDVNHRPAGKPAPETARLRSWFGFLGRYVGVGVLVSGTDYLIFLLALAGGSTAVWANVLGRVVSTVVGATLHRRYTFAGPQRLGVRRQMLAYGTLSVVNLGLSSGLIYLLVDGLALPPLWAKVATDIVIIVFSMVISRVLIFAPSR
jgi:putative flippase GtrA